MLKELCIRDFKLLRDVNLSFTSGLTVLTGETGAGKTQCLEALAATIGTRLGDDAISKASKKAIVSAVFDLSDRPDVLSTLRSEGWLDDDETEVILERTVERDGRSRGRLNGRRVPIGTLQTIGNHLIDTLGQHARADLLTRPALEILDSMGDGKHRDRLSSVNKLYSEWLDSRVEFEREEIEIARASERRELVEFQHAELDNAEIKSGEERELTKEAELLESARERIEDANKAASILSGEDENTKNARDMLQEALDCIERLTGTDDKLKGEATRIREMVYLSDELADTLRRYADGVVDDPARRVWVEERLATLHRLQRKYKCNESGLIDLHKSLADELNIVKTATERLSELARRRDEFHSGYLKEAVALSKSRARLAKRISKEVKNHLADLDLPNATFTVELKSNSDDEKSCRADGIDRADLLIATNPAQKPASLKKVASGGELSRLLIALKTVLANRDRVPVLVFDEAEAGIGGETAFKVGEKLSELSESHQLILVSHLPQIASQANGHWVIEKSTSKSETRADARTVAGDERVDEIGRMLGDRGDRSALEKLARSFLGE